MIFRTIYKFFFILLPLCLIAGIAWYMIETALQERLSIAGVPKAISWDISLLSTHILRNDGFMLGYSEWRQNPLWVIYKLTPTSSKKTYKLKRLSHFSIDPRTIVAIKADDYTRSGYDRGHMAPNHAISSLYGKQAQKQSFLMTNITPQKPKLNRVLWQRLEEVEYSYFKNWFKELWVLTGPIFDNTITRLESGVEIPDKFFKIYLAITKETLKIQMLSFNIPQNGKGNED